MSIGNTYTIVVPDGDPDSIKIIHKGNWMGELVQFSRESYKRNRNTSPYKEILDRPGVYILIGPDDAGIKVYIGEGDGIKGRIESLVREKAASRLKGLDDVVEVILGDISDDEQLKPILDTLDTLMEEYRSKE